MKVSTTGGHTPCLLPRTPHYWESFYQNITTLAIMVPPFTSLILAILSDHSSRTFSASRSEQSNDVFPFVSYTPTSHPSSSTPTNLPTGPWPALDRQHQSEMPTATGKSHVPPQEPSPNESTTESTPSVRPTSSLTSLMSLDISPALSPTTPWPTSHHPTSHLSSTTPTFLPTSPWPTLNRHHQSDAPKATGVSQMSSDEPSSASSNKPTTFLTTLISLEIAPALSPTTPWPTSAVHASDLAMDEFKFAEYLGSSYHRHDSVTFQSEGGVRCRSNSGMDVASQVESISIPYYYRLSGGIDLQPQVQRIESAVLSNLGANLLDCMAEESYENGGRVVAIYGDDTITTTPSQGEIRSEHSWSRPMSQCLRFLLDVARSSHRSRR